MCCPWRGARGRRSDRELETASREIVAVGSVGRKNHMTTIEVIAHLNGTCCVATDRHRNRLLVLPENYVIAEWAGAEVTASVRSRKEGTAAVVSRRFDFNVPAE